MANRENKSTNFFETHSFIFTSILIPIFHKIIKIFYIKYIAKYYELDTYYFEHITLDYFFSTMIIFTIFLFLVNYYNIYLNSSSKIYISIFLLIIFSYYILGIFTIINHNIFSQEICIFFTCIVILLILALKNFYPWYILCSTLLFIIVFIINFSSIKLKKEYEIATLKNYQKVVILTLQDSDYLIVPFEEKDNILYLKTKNRRWLNRLDSINIQSKKYQQVKINSAPI